MTPSAAADLACEALIFLADRPEMLGRFLAETGADAATLRQAAADPGTLGFVLDFLLGDEALVREFSAQAGIDPAMPAQARAALPGGTLPNWT